MHKNCLHIHWEILNTYEELINLKLTESSGSIIKIKDKSEGSLKESVTRRRMANATFCRHRKVKTVELTNK